MLAQTKPFPVAGIARYIEREAKQMKSLAGSVRSGDVDAIHDMRVASRRLRVALRESHALLPNDAYAQLRDAVTGVTESLGHSRELDVMALMMEEYRKDAYGPWQRTVDHVIAELRAVRQEAQQECLAALEHLDKQRFDAPLKQVLEALKQSKEQDLHGIGQGLSRRLAAVRKAWRDWRETDEPDHLHKVRIAVKKLRYAAEFFAPAYDKRLGALVEELKHAQEILGDWHDAQVLMDALRRIEKHAPYREVQGFPLIIEAFDLFSEHKETEFLEWARGFFDKPRRDALKEYLGAA